MRLFIGFVFFLKHFILYKELKTKQERKKLILDKLKLIDLKEN